MPECDDCGAHVSPTYARVFAGADGLTACSACRTQAEMFDAAGAAETSHPDPMTRDPDQ